MLESFGQLSNLTFPVLLASTINVVLVNDENVSIVSNSCIQVNNPEVLSHDAALFSVGRLVSDFLNSIKGITHDCDKQVEENNLCHEGGRKEHEPYEHAISTTVIIVLELTKSN